MQQTECKQNRAVRPYSLQKRPNKSGNWPINLATFDNKSLDEACLGRSIKLDRILTLEEGVTNRYK